MASPQAQQLRHSSCSFADVQALLAIPSAPPCARCRARWEAHGGPPSGPPEHPALDKPLQGWNKHKYTICEVRLHRQPEDVWLVAQKMVFDVTRFVADHPGGSFAIFRNAGEILSDEDWLFHSEKARKMWKKAAIGKITSCDAYSVPSLCTIS